LPTRNLLTPNAGITLEDAPYRDFGIADYIRPVYGPTAVVANGATIRSDPATRAGRIAISRVVISADAGTGGALVILYSGIPAPDRIIDAVTIPATAPAAIFAFPQSVVLQEFETLTAVVSNLNGATNVYMTMWAALLRPKSAIPHLAPDTESVNAEMMPYEDEVMTPEKQHEDSAQEMGRPHRAMVY
jgi:hypothetical protein